MNNNNTVTRIYNCFVSLLVAFMADSKGIVRMF